MKVSRWLGKWRSARHARSIEAGVAFFLAGEPLRRVALEARRHFR